MGHDMGGSYETEHENKVYVNHFVDDLTPEKLEEAKRGETLSNCTIVLCPKQTRPVISTDADKYLLAVREYCESHYTWRGVFKKICNNLRTRLRFKSSELRVFLSLKFQNPYVRLIPCGIVRKVKNIVLNLFKCLCPPAASRVRLRQCPCRVFARTAKRK